MHFTSFFNPVDDLLRSFSSPAGDADAIHSSFPSNKSSIIESIKNFWHHIGNFFLQQNEKKWNKWSKSTITGIGRYFIFCHQKIGSSSSSSAPLSFLLLLFHLVAFKPSSDPVKAVEATIVFLTNLISMMEGNGEV